jgi:hypothetical protein
LKNKTQTSLYTGRSNKGTLGAIIIGVIAFIGIVIILAFLSPLIVPILPLLIILAVVVGVEYWILKWLLT